MGVADHLLQERYRVPILAAGEADTHPCSAVATEQASLQAVRVCYRAFLGLLAVTGMRVSEAIALDDEDVGTDEALIMVRHGKGGRQRELVVHPSAAYVLGEYRQIRRCACPRPKTTAFFISTRGTRLRYSNVLFVFRQLLGELGLSAAGSQGRPPRIHDLRHRLAIVSLLGWYRDGFDVQPGLPVSTHLGHASASPDGFHPRDPARLRLPSRPGSE